LNYEAGLIKITAFFLNIYFIAFFFNIYFIT